VGAAWALVWFMASTRAMSGSALTVVLANSEQKFRFKCLIDF
jgi:hypothetical protein